MKERLARIRSAIDKYKPRLLLSGVGQLVEDLYGLLSDVVAELEKRK